MCKATWQPCWTMAAGHHYSVNAYALWWQGALAAMCLWLLPCLQRAASPSSPCKCCTSKPAQGQCERPALFFILITLLRVWRWHGIRPYISSSFLLLLCIMFSVNSLASPISQGPRPVHASASAGQALEPHCFLASDLSVLTLTFQYQG